MGVSQVSRVGTGQEVTPGAGRGFAWVPVSWHHPCRLADCVDRLAELERRERVHRTAREVFGVYDLDGDGAITREEWAGTCAVFDALDLDGDGRVTPQDLAAGLGGAFCLQDRDGSNAP